jgi:hypothetical protein
MHLLPRQVDHILPEDTTAVMPCIVLGVSTEVLCVPQVQTATALVRQEGVLALWKGWLPAVTRGILYGGAHAQQQQQQQSLTVCIQQ